MPEIKLNDRTITYTLIRRKRKTAKLKIISAKELLFSIPVRLSNREAEQLLLSKANWITTQIEHLTALATNPVNSEISAGKPILYQGQPYILAFQTGTEQVNLSLNQIGITAPTLSAIPNILLTWYQTQAALILKEKTAYWSQCIRVAPAKITLRDQKTRWGSCSQKKHISYNWRIIMAPPEVIDYLIIHELSHIKEMNHSSAYWSLVAQYSPNWKQHRRWLNTNSHLLYRLFQNNN